MISYRSIRKNICGMLLDSFNIYFLNMKILIYLKAYQIFFILKFALVYVKNVNKKIIRKQRE